MPRWVSVLGRYAIAIAAAIGLLAFLAAEIVPLHGMMFSVPLAVVALFTMWLGAGPGTIMSLLVATGAWYLFVKPERSWSLRDPLDLLRIVAFEVAAATVIIAMAVRTRAVRQAQAAHLASERLLAAIRETDRRKSEFIAMLSHELRNPLTPIHNGLYLLRHAPPGSASAERAQAVIERQVGQLTRLVDDLLDVTRIGSGKVRLRLERHDLAEIARRTAADHEPIAERVGVTLRVHAADTPIFVDVDSARIVQSIGNLLTNAFKFTPRGGHVDLTLESDLDRARVRVSDDGAGIPPEMLEELFQPFAQGSQTLARTAGGLGLGLALVKGLIELHGGSVTATSPGIGKGATFTMALPLARDARGDPGEVPAEREASGPSPDDPLPRR